MKNRLFLWSAVAVLLLLGMACAAGSTSSTWVLVNSNNFADDIGGQIFALEHNASYAFALTPSQADYLASFVTPSSSPVWYYESATPMVSGMSAQLTALNNPNLHTAQNANLAGWFASQAPGNAAAVVGTSDGAEALSIAPFVANQNGGLYFATPSTVDSVISGLKAQNKSIWVYGSIASSASASSLSGVQVINTGSKYSDNLQVIAKFASMQPIKQISFVSGKAFEKSMIDASTPVALVGRTEVSPALVSWIKSSGVSNGQAFQGDDVLGAVASIKSSTGLPVFVKLSEGYTGNAAVQPLTMMALPGPSVVLKLGDIGYNAQYRTFWLAITNAGNVPAYVKLTATLPDGSSASSNTVTIQVGASQPISAILDASQYVSYGQIPTTSFAISSSSLSSMMESVDVVNETAIAVTAAPAPTSAPSPPAYSAPAPTPYAPAPSSDNSLWIGVAVLAIVIVGGYLFTMGSKTGKKGKK